MPPTPPEQADLARRRLGVGVDGPLPDLLRLIEDEAQVAVFVLPLPKGGVDGAYVTDRGLPFILINQNGDPTKKRFTLAHEYGHHFLEHGAQLDRIINPSATVTGIEREAYLFASAFLMPDAAVDGWFARHGNPSVTLEVLVEFAFSFNVSVPAALMRLSGLTRVRSGGEHGTTALWAALKKRQHSKVARAAGYEYDTDTLKTAHAIGSYVPVRVQRKIVDGVDRGLLGQEAAVALMHIPDEQTALARLADMRGDVVEAEDETEVQE